MLSIICCSKNINQLENWKANVEETVGCNYEIILIDNSTNKYSIFSAYNEGEKQAKGNLLCFVHEDVMFISKDWGVVVENLFAEHKKMGLLGVVGGHVLPDTPCYYGDTQVLSGRIIDNNNKEHLMELYNSDAICDVVVVDGVWFCVRKDLFNRIHFDESFSGFHLYDMDICMQVLQSGYDVKITKQIILQHFFKGVNNPKMLMKNITVFYKKWQQYFPLLKGINMEEKYLSLIKASCSNYMTARQLFINYLHVYNSFDYKLGKFLTKPYKICRYYINKLNKTKHN